MNLERREYNEFSELWFSGQLTHLRYGQAFYNHFNLHKVNNQKQFGDLYELDGEEARRAIHQIFKFN